MTYRFNSDYTEGCHPAVLEKLVQTNMEQTDGYGLDPYCDEARKLIREAFACPNADVHFLVGGTQTNLTVICAALRPHQAVYGAVPSHINTHEAGAIEHVGHRVLPLPSEDGKLTAEQIRHEWKCTIPIPAASIGLSRKWFISPNRQKSAACTAKRAAGFISGLQGLRSLPLC